MDYSVVYSSSTRNTAILANIIKDEFDIQNCMYFGGSDVKVIGSPIVFVGFWTDKGTCDDKTKNFLKEMKDKSIFLFGTAGFGGSKEYYDKILNRVQENLDPSNKVFGTYMCQGKIPVAVRKRYETMQTGDTLDSKIKAQIENFDSALSHPDKEDCEKLRK